MWQLLLLFTFAAGEPEVVVVDAPDAATCVAMGSALSKQIELKWGCKGPSGEIITDEEGGEL